MIAGCYSMDLYCRHETLPLWFEYPKRVPKGHHGATEFPHQFTGQTERECRAEAREKGWVFSARDATCPRCSKKDA